MNGTDGETASVNWVQVAALNQIPRLGARVVRLGQRAIAIFRTSDDRVFALLDRCPHRGGPLSQGIVHGNCVTCPLHDWVIDLTTGKATGPDEGSTDSYPVRAENGNLLLGVSGDTDPAQSDRQRTVIASPAEAVSAALR